MHDPALHRLVTALDGLIEAQPDDIHCDLDVAALRLQCLSRRLGILAEDSPYLAFIRRVLDDQRHAPLAASA